MAGDEGESDEGAREVCLCFHVTLRMLVRHTRAGRVRVASQLAECHGAGTGCGWCRPQLESIMNQVALDPAAMPSLPWDPGEYARRRAKAHAERAADEPRERLVDEIEP